MNGAEQPPNLDRSRQRRAFFDICFRDICDKMGIGEIDSYAESHTTHDQFALGRLVKTDTGYNYSKITEGLAKEFKKNLVEALIQKFPAEDWKDRVGLVTFGEQHVISVRYTDGDTLQE